MFKFMTVRGMIYVLCVFLASRAWLYRQYFALNGGSVTSYAIQLVFILFLIYIILTLKSARKSKRMVTHGAYRLVAHPAYATYVIVDLPLWFLMPLSSFAVVTGILLYAVILITAYLEENYLIHRFGDEARSYYGKTLSVHFLLSLVGIRK